MSMRMLLPSSDDTVTESPLALWTNTLLVLPWRLENPWPISVYSVTGRLIRPVA